MIVNEDLMVIKLSRSNFELILKNHPIRTLDIFDSALIGCFLSTSTKLVLQSFITFSLELKYDVS